MGVKIEYVGSFQEGTTESHWSASLELLGHDVIRLQEDQVPWSDRIIVADECDMLLWTSTWGYNEKWSPREASQAIAYLNERIPTAAVHLDRWWGLSNREWQIRESAMFQVRWLFTADGDHDQEWADAGVNHRWLPPGVFAPECVPGTPKDEWLSDVAFIGNWQEYGHAEHWPYRKAMLDHLRSELADRLAFWPRQSEPGPWGPDYNDLLASVKVVVGDSWQGANRYWSNRVFEVIGRGGFCVHPAVPALVDMLPEGLGVAYFEPGDWEAMTTAIEQWTADNDGRAAAIAAGQAFVREHHSYTSRMSHMLDTMQAEGAWA